MPTWTEVKLAVVFSRWCCLGLVFTVSKKECSSAFRWGCSLHARP